MTYVGFDALKEKFAREGLRNPGGAAYVAGVKKYGKRAMRNAAKSGHSLRRHKQLASFVKKHG